MNALQKEELRLLKLLVQNQEAQLMENPVYRMLIANQAMIASLTSAPDSENNGRRNG